jgi:hypothetical protein
MLARARAYAGNLPEKRRSMENQGENASIRFM